MKQAGASRHGKKSALLLGLALCCTSCLYSRLLSFKDQLASFERHVVLTNGGRTLQFQTPVVRGGDLTELTGFGPTHIDWPAADRQAHTYRYRSLSPPDGTGTPPLLVFTLHFSSNELFAFDYPAEVAEVLGTNLVVAAARAIGKSRLLQREHRLDWALGSNQTSTLIPSRAAISTVLGPPQQAGADRSDAYASYRFLLEGTNGSAQSPPAALSADFQFDPITTLLRHGVIHVGKLKLVVDFPGPS